jgi:hypothetical protein
MKDHWEKVYGKKAFADLGWYEALPEPSLELINRCALSPDSHILIVGAGATTLIDQLLDSAQMNISGNDISLNALDQIKDRLGPEKSNLVNWIPDDLTNPESLNLLSPVDLWHDRAVLHFFTEASDQESYFNILKKLVRVRAHVIIAGFNLNGAQQCSGLPVNRLDEDMLKEKLGSGFDIIKSFDYLHVMPKGETREYIYTLFQRTS